MRIGYWITVALFGAGTVAVCVLLSSALSAAEVYDQAPTCLFGACDASDVRQVDATVLQVGESGGKSPRNWLVLGGLGSTPQSVDFTKGGGVWPRVHPGDTVTVSIWRGLVTEVRKGQVSSEAWDNPDFTVYNDSAGLLLVATPFLALIVGPAVNRSARMRGTGWFFSAWIVLASGIYFVVSLVSRQGMLLLVYLVSLAAAGVLLMPATALVNQKRSARLRSASAARP